MSKMSELHAELSSQAYDMGYESLGVAEEMGCAVDWDNAKLIPPEESAHKEWLEKKSQVLTRLGQLQIYLNNRTEHGHFWGKDDWEVVADAIKFIEDGEV